MTEITDIQLKGASGNSYPFVTYSLDTTFNNVAVVYAVVRRHKKNDGKIYQKILYVGETGGLIERFEDHHKADCCLHHDANAISLLREDNENRRRQIEADLIEQHHPPCND